MGLLDGLEKLINEHGSAAILKERIALANDKHMALESEAKTLRLEKEVLRCDSAKLQEQISNLEKQLAEIQNNPLRFDEVTGTWVGEGSNIRYCAKCKTRNIPSPMTNESSGWRCPACDGYFPDPSRKAKTSVRSAPNWRVA
jgi:hypothetical protein